MAVHVLKTNVTSKRKVQELSPVFNNHRSIRQWSVDTEDRHNVVRIEANDDFGIDDAIRLIQAQGFNGDELDC